MVIALHEQCVGAFPRLKIAFREIGKGGLIEINPELLSQGPEVPPDRVVFLCRPRVFVGPPDGAQVALVTDRAASPVASYRCQLLDLRREYRLFVMNRADDQDAPVLVACPKVARPLAHSGAALAVSDYVPRVVEPVFLYVRHWTITAV
jgi:hypothetical protein